MSTSACEEAQQNSQTSLRRLHPNLLRRPEFPWLRPKGVLRPRWLRPRPKPSLAASARRLRRRRRQRRMRLRLLRRRPEASQSQSLRWETESLSTLRRGWCGQSQAAEHLRPPLPSARLPRRRSRKRRRVKPRPQEPRPRPTSRKSRRSSPRRSPRGSTCRRAPPQCCAVCAPRRGRRVRASPGARPAPKWRAPDPRGRAARHGVGAGPVGRTASPSR
mmetsp:Transcript_32957/g.78349  ORF Transcript_32957/g.78349 Transcript_32957/m.78349 type:complete len:218 (+) Transcript_32957:243-896(+)